MTHRWEPQGLLARVVGFALGMLILVVAFVFSLVIFSIVLTATLLAIGYAWWRIRSNRVRTGRVIDVEGGREIRPRDPR